MFCYNPQLILNPQIIAPYQLQYLQIYVKCFQQSQLGYTRFDMFIHFIMNSQEPISNDQTHRDQQANQPQRDSPSAIEQRQLKEKKALKQEARQSLLKQCYKMAMNKYLRLIEMGGEGFTARQWSVVHLNTAISLQFQDKLDEALHKTNEAIKIDPTYEKCYYRRLQILDQLQNYELALHENIVPAFIKNAEVDSLRQQIAEKYRANVGLVSLKKKMFDTQFKQKLGTQTKLNIFFEDSLSAIFVRYIKPQHRLKNQVEEVKNCKEQERISQIIANLERSGRDLAEFYRQLKQKEEAQKDSKEEIQKIQRWMSKLYQQIYKISIQYMLDEETKIETHTIEYLLKPFWTLYISNLSKIVMDQQELLKWFRIQQQLQGKQMQDYQIKLFFICPLCLLNLDIFIKVVQIVSQAILHKQQPTQPTQQQIAKSLTKLVHNNIKYLKYATHTKMNADRKQIKRLQQKVLRLIEEALKSCKLEQWGYIDALVSELLSIYYLISSKAEDMVEMQIIPPTQFCSLYISTYKLSSNSHRSYELQHQVITKMHEIFIKSAVVKKNLPSLQQIYLSYRSLHNINISQLRQQKQYSGQNLQQFIFSVLADPGNADLVQYSIKQGQELKHKQNDIVKFMLLLNLMGYLNPAFVTKIMQQARQAAKKQSSPSKTSMSSNKMVRALQTFCLLDRLLPILGSQSQHSQYSIAIYMQLLSLLALSDMILLYLILDHPSQISNLYLHLLKIRTMPSSICSPIISIFLQSSSIKLLYMLTADTITQRQQDYADKMGVSQQEIRKVKKLQGEYQQDYLEMLQEIQNKRQKFITLLISQFDQKVDGCTWRSVLEDMVKQVVKIDQSKIEASMLVGIILRLAQKQSTKFYSNCIIKFMLDQYNPSPNPNKPLSITQTKLLYNISLFMVTICKKCNPSIFTYTQLQPITNCLIYIIENGKHQLHIFEAFLSLINLSSRKVKIPFRIAQTGMMEENQYIVHAGLELANNILINMEEIKQEESEKVQKMKDIIYKYYLFYKNTLNKQLKSEETPVHKVALTNYSHPYKIYMTLLSLLLVLQAISDSNKQLKSQYKVEQFDNWKYCLQILKHLHKNNADISITLFKLVLHHVDAKTLPSGWNKGLEDALQKLKMTDGDKWAKIAKYISK